MLAEKVDTWIAAYKAEGRIEGMVTILERMKKAGMPEEEIAKITGMPEEEIISLIKKVVIS